MTDDNLPVHSDALQCFQKLCRDHDYAEGYSRLYDESAEMGGVSHDQVHRPAVGS